MLILLVLAAIVALLTFVVPWFMAAPTTLKQQDRMMAWTRNGLSIAAVIAGLGFLLGVTATDGYLGPSVGGMRGNLLLAALCFAFAGSRFFKRLLGSNPNSWS
jgi:hypothetical protein